MSTTASKLDYCLTPGDFSLTPDQIEVLASEFFGVKPVAAHGAPHALCIRFHDLTHADVIEGKKWVTRAQDCHDAFKTLLEGYRNPPSEQI